MKRKRIKVAVSGVTGNVGYATIFRVATGEMFGPDTEVELKLLETPRSGSILKGIAMELEDSALPLLKKISYTADMSEAMRDVNWAILIGAARRKKGMERVDLLEINGKIFSEQGRALNKYAAKDVQVFVVGNPCNTNCLIAMENAPDIPRDRFFAMTGLDHNRAKAQLAKKAGVSVEEVTNVTVWGNHSATQFPDFYNAKINGKPVPEVIDDLNWLQKDFIETNQKRGAAVIEALGYSSAGSAAVAISNSIHNLSHDTPEGDTFSMALVSEGQYGVDPGLVFSFPCFVKNGELKVAEGFEFNNFAREKFELTFSELKHERDLVREMGLV